MTTYVTHAYSNGRPCIPVLIGVNQPRLFGLANANRAVPQPVVRTLLIDTGAEDTYVDRDTMVALELFPINTVLVQTGVPGSRPIQFDQYEISFKIQASISGQNDFKISSMPVLCGDFSGQGINGLLGRDVLAFCEATFSGRHQTVSLIF